MPRKKLNKDQELIVYCLVARLRDKNYNSGFEGFDFVFDEIVQATRLYISTSGLDEDYRNKARAQFDGITFGEVEKGKAEGIVNTFKRTAKEKARELADFIEKLILPTSLEDHKMEFWGDTAKGENVSRYFHQSIYKLRYSKGAFEKAGKTFVEGRERELIPCGRISIDLQSKFDTKLKELGRLIQFDGDLLEWITNRIKIDSPYSYRAVKPNVKSIIKALKEEKKGLRKMETGYLVSMAVNNYELANKPDYILNEAKYKDLLQKTFDQYF